MTSMPTDQELIAQVRSAPANGRERLIEQLLRRHGISRMAPLLAAALEPTTDVRPASGRWRDAIIEKGDPNDA
jgi:hypothetical protein